MRETMARQPEDLRALLADPAPVERAAALLDTRRVLLVGIGTSLHAAEQGAWLLRAAGVQAWAVHGMDAALHGRAPQEDDALLLLSHTGTTGYSKQVLAEARARGIPALRIGARGTDAELETVAPETSAAYTASHLGALMRLAQIASALGATLELDALAGAVAEVLEDPSPGVAPPERLLEYTGAGPNAWTASEGSLKVRETARIAAEGLGVEQLFHGPAVALDSRDALVCLDGGGPGAERLAAVAGAAEQVGVRVHRFTSPAGLGELESIFPLTAVVQRIALECAEQLGTDPDAFGYDVPGREEAWEPLGF